MKRIEKEDSESDDAVEKEELIKYEKRRASLLT